jgi:hypothetical protein
MSTNVLPFFSVFWFLLWSMRLPAGMYQPCLCSDFESSRVLPKWAMHWHILLYFFARVPRFMNNAQQGMNASDHAGGGRQEILALLA